MGLDRDGERKPEFTDFSEFRAVATQRVLAYGNVIKAAALRFVGQELIGSGEAPSSPRVTVRKKGETVEGVEFHCSCGRQASLFFDSEGE